MKNTLGSDKTITLISYGMAAVSLTVFTSGVTDPVNVTKLFVLSGFIVAAVATLDKERIKFLIEAHKVSILALGIFVCVSIIVLIDSSAPFEQSLYGVYGRNNGFLLYILLAILFVSTLRTMQNNYFQRIINAMWITGLVNVIYGLWVIIFGDFIGWNNPYGSLLGTLGNPNFAGSLMGMFSAVVVVKLVQPNGTTRDKVIALVILVLLLVAIRETNAVQGRVLLATSSAVVIFYLIWALKKSSRALIIYFVTVIPIGILSLLGTLQIGPLTKFLYKTSVSLRGEYWSAAIETGLRNPWTGVGFDSFGDWYRRTRRDSSLILPGPDTVTNAAHNVFLDIFSFGGFPLLVSYICLNLIVLVSIINQTRRNRTFDPVFVSLVTIWLGYQLQSVISINQIGLAVWGWGLSGCIIAYEKNYSRSNKESMTDVKSGKHKRKQNSSPSFSLRLFAGSLIGFSMAFPPLNADIKWSSAQKSMLASDFENVLTRTWLNPMNSIKIEATVAQLEASGLHELAHKYALIAVEFNPNSYYSWENLFRIKNSTPSEKKLARQKLLTLEPNFERIDVGALK
jgi:O-Antigen ligase